jgi:hypothetical protein
MVDFDDNSKKSVEMKTSAASTVSTPNEKTTKLKDPLSSSSVQSKKPFPWPFFLALLLPASVLGTLAWELNQRDFTMGFRIAWDSLCSIVPGISIMILLGALVQFRKRPFLSSVSILLSGAFLGGSYWSVQKIIEQQLLN